MNSGVIVGVGLIGSLFVAAGCADIPAEETLGEHVDAIAGGGRYCNAGCVVELYKTLAPTYRPTGEEGEIRARILAMIDEANEDRWCGRLEVLGPDAIGNFVVRVPATGEYARRRYLPVAIQSHIDMVLAATEVPPGGDLKAYFRAHPVALETAGDLLQSVGQKTTIGADDLSGTALQLRYAIDPTIAHPPLELVFTVHEEVGLTGAANYDTQLLPLRAPILITTDGPLSADHLLYGSQGSMRRSVSGTVAASAATPDRLVKVTVSKLLGGHSGNDIYRQRLNAAIAAAAMAELAFSTPTLGLVDAVSGELAGLNKIPTSFELTFAVGAAFDTAALRATLQQELAALIASHPGEAGNTQVALAVTDVALPAAPVTVLAPAAANAMIAAVLALETAAPPMNGVISTSPEFPQSVNTSSNLGFLQARVDPATAARHTVTLAFMARSFSADELGVQTTRIVEQLRSTFADPAATTVTAISGYNPWFQDPTSRLVKVVAGPPSHPRFSQVTVVAAGLEASYFLAKFPGLQILGMGAAVNDAHTVRENVSIASFATAARKLDETFRALAAADFLDRKPHQ